MSRAPWLHVDPLPVPGETAALDPEETRHAAGARRLAAGDTVVLSDGRGTTAVGELVAAGRRDSRVRVIEHREHFRELPEIHLACALPKGDRVATLLSMVTQIGVSSFTPLRCRRSVVLPAESTPPRWDRILRESGKQSRQPFLPRIEAAASPSEAAEGGAHALWLLDPDGRTIGDAPEAHVSAASHLVLVGPEGGLDPTETEAVVAAGAARVSLGRGILRVETAAIAGVAALRARLG